MGKVRKWMRRKGLEEVDVKRMRGAREVDIREVDAKEANIRKRIYKK